MCEDCDRTAEYDAMEDDDWWMQDDDWWWYDDMEDVQYDDEKFRQAVSAVYVHAEELLMRKHKDYGPKNIGLSPGGPLNGLRVRMHDKLARINNLLDSGAEPTNESFRDSWLDLMNYAAIGLLVIDNKWPNE